MAHPLFSLRTAALLTLASIVAASWTSPSAQASAACIYKKLSPQVSARRAGLHYVKPGEAPGIVRVMVEPKAFSYHLPTGERIEDQATLARIKQLRIPPGYTDVWISTDPLAHVQATGINSAGKLQYRYHPQWDRIRAEQKFGRVIRFGERVPLMRERIARSLEDKSTPLSRERML